MCVCVCVCVWIMAVWYGFDDAGSEDQYLTIIYRYRYMKINPHGKQNTPAERGGRERGRERESERESAEAQMASENTPAIPYLTRRKTLCTL